MYCLPFPHPIIKVSLSKKLLNQFKVDFDRFEFWKLNLIYFKLDWHVQTLFPPGGKGISALVALVTREEFRRAVMSMKSFKAPSPDDFQQLFFKQY